MTRMQLADTLQVIEARQETKVAKKLELKVWSFLKGRHNVTSIEAMKRLVKEA
jgi:hypothetical protein